MNSLPPNADELVSAYLDGEATPDEVVTVESHPELVSRVEELRALSGVLSSPVAASAEQKEAHLSAALSLFDDLFAADAAPAAPVLAVVPDAVTPVAADPDLVTTAADTSPVVSLASARERRRPRRFNMGVIAAATAALLLFVGLAALSFGRNSNDVATADTRIEAAEAMAADAADDGADVFADDAEDGDGSSAGLSELESSRAVEPPAAAAIQAEADAAEAAEAPMDDAADDSAGADDAAASDQAEAAADGDAAMNDAESFAEAEAAPFAYDLFLGDFVDDESLREELEHLTAQDLRKRTDLFEPGLFPGCQQEVPELAKADVVTLVGEAMVDGQPVEIHVLSTDNRGLSLLVIDPLDDCAILSTIP